MWKWITPWPSTPRCLNGGLRSSCVWGQRWKRHTVDGYRTYCFCGTLSVHRLELTAAGHGLASQSMCVKPMNNKSTVTEKVWCDSQVAFGWIHSNGPLEPCTHNWNLEINEILSEVRRSWCVANCWGTAPHVSGQQMWILPQISEHSRLV